VCKDRLETVKKLLDDRFGNANEDA
jgi:hypothetical protein